MILCSSTGDQAPMDDACESMSKIELSSFTLFRHVIWTQEYPQVTNTEISFILKKGVS